MALLRHCATGKGWPLSARLQTSIPCNVPRTFGRLRFTMLLIASSANETRSVIHGQLPAGGHHIVSQDVAGAVVALHLEIAVVGREPRIQDLGNLNWPAAKREPARRQLA